MSRAQLILEKSRRISSSRKENRDPFSDDSPDTDGGRSRDSSPAKPTLVCASPKIQPLRVAHVFSPSASPSAGILKRRRLSGDHTKETPSPPNKVKQKYRYFVFSVYIYLIKTFSAKIVYSLLELF